MRAAGVNYSTKTDCASGIKRDFNVVLAACVAASPTNRADCANAASAFKAKYAADLSCTIQKSVLGKASPVSQTVVQALRDQAGVDYDAGGACGELIEADYYRLATSCSELTSAVQASSCRTAADAFSAAWIGVNCQTSAQPSAVTVNAAEIARLKAKADLVPQAH